MQAKRGATKAAHRASAAMEKAYHNDPEQRARHQAALDLAAKRQGFYTAGAN